MAQKFEFFTNEAVEGSQEYEQGRNLAERAVSLYHTLHPCFPCKYQKIYCKWEDDNHGFSPSTVDFLCTINPTVHFKVTIRCAYYEDPYNTKPAIQSTSEK